MRAREDSFHPVRKFLNGLVWDGTPRLNYWLETYLGSEPSPYVRSIGRMFLVGDVVGAGSVHDAAALSVFADKIKPRSTRMKAIARCSSRTATNG